MWTISCESKTQYFDLSHVICLYSTTAATVGRVSVPSVRVRESLCLTLEWRSLLECVTFVSRMWIRSESHFCCHGMYMFWYFIRGGSEGSTAAADMDADLPVEYLRSSLAQESQVPSSVPSGGGGNSEQEQEEDDLQLAIAMSLNEQENKPKKSLHAPVSHHVPSPTPPPTSATPSAPPPAQSTLYSTIIHDRTHVRHISPHLMPLIPTYVIAGPSLHLLPPIQRPSHPARGGVGQRSCEIEVSVSIECF